MALGDQLRVYRGGYWHHGIDSGNGNIIHFGMGSNWKAEVAEVPFPSFTKGSTLVERLPARHSPFSPDEIVARARAMIGRQPYNFALHNCESLAGFCQGLEPDSPQVRSMKQRTTEDFRSHGPVGGSVRTIVRVAGRIASLAVALTGRHRTAFVLERATDRRADIHWTTDRHELRWEPYS